MKRILPVSLMVCFYGLAWAQRPTTSAGASRPTTSVSAVYPQTTAGATRPQTTVSVTHPTTGAVTYPQTTAGAIHPQTQTGAVYPQTTLEVTHPQTTVAVFHPQTPSFAEAEKPGSAAASSGNAAGKATSAQATTSMSDFTPKKAKDFKQQDAKAPQFGGGSLTLGNDTGDEAAKDAIAAGQLRNKSHEAVENFDPKNNPGAALGGLEKALTDRAKVEQKK